eukprot:TRINITY_DN4427_c1_g1_i1.p1 TRINITY_DN4427_c1_g1~~TRINITY_DN4427_c1_g1_i1.p1  ORF type:complete len:717 (-),score=134.16 TRINITY_DN4427_c1_g1_i1:290-2215(-)
MFGEDDISVHAYENWDFLVIKLADKLKDPSDIKYSRLAKRWQKVEFFKFERDFRSNLEKTIEGIKEKESKDNEGAASEIIDLFFESIQNEYWVDTMNVLREFGKKYINEFLELEMMTEKRGQYQSTITYFNDHAPIPVFIALIKLLSSEQKFEKNKHGQNVFSFISCDSPPEMIRALKEGVDLKRLSNHFIEEKLDMSDFPCEVILELLEGLSSEFLVSGDYPFKHAFDDDCPLETAMEILDKVSDDFRDSEGQTKYMIGATKQCDNLPLKREKLCRICSGLSFDEMCKTNKNGMTLLNSVITSCWNDRLLQILLDNLKTKKETSTCFNIQNRQGNTTIMLACMECTEAKGYESLKILLNQVSPDMIAPKNDQGCNILFFLTRRLKTNEDFEPEIIRIIKMASIEERTLEAKVKMGFRKRIFFRTSSLLMHALQNSFVPRNVIAAILEGTPMQYRDIQNKVFGQTALMYALENGFSRDIIELLMKGTDKEHHAIVDFTGRNLLHSAMSGFKFSTRNVEFVLDVIGDEYKEKYDNEGRTPMYFMLARCHSKHQYCKFLELLGNLPLEPSFYVKQMKKNMTNLLVNQKGLQLLWIFDEYRISSTYSNDDDVNYHFNDETMLDTIIWSGIEYVTGPLVKDKARF